VIGFDLVYIIVSFKMFAVISSALYIIMKRENKYVSYAPPPPSPEIGFDTEY
jgi:hypothetical protein